MSRAELTEKVLATKLKKGLTWAPRPDEWLYFYGAEWK